MWVDRAISLESAYAIENRSSSVAVHQLFRALDRLRADFALINEDSQAQRSKVIQRLSYELEKRRIPLRHPEVEKRSISLIREQLGFSQCGTRDLHPQTPDNRATPNRYGIA